MNKQVCKILGFSLILLLPSVALATPPLNDGIIAIVNNDVITVKDLKDYVGTIYRQMKIEHKTPEEIQQIIMSYEEKGVNQLIEDRLILNAAKEKGIEVRGDIISKKLDEIKSRYPSEDAFYAELSSQGLTVTDLKNKLLDQLKGKYIVDVEVKDKVFVNPEDVTKYYNEHQGEFASKTKYNLDSVYISFEKGKDEALAKINEARKRLQAGEDFAKIAKEYSQSASIGAIEEGQMVPAVEKEIFALKVGDISQAIEVGGGVYIFKLNGITQGYMQSLAESKDAIFDKLYTQEFQDKFKAWVDKLRSKAYVEIR